MSDRELEGSGCCAATFRLAVSSTWCSGVIIASSASAAALDPDRPFSWVEGRGGGRNVESSFIGNLGRERGGGGGGVGKTCPNLFVKVEVECVAREGDCANDESGWSGWDGN